MQLMKRVNRFIHGVHWVMEFFDVILWYDSWFDMTQHPPGAKKVSDSRNEERKGGGATVALLLRYCPKIRKFRRLSSLNASRRKRQKKTIKSEQTKQAKKETEEPDTLKVVQTYGADAFAFGYFWTDPLLQRFTELLSNCPLQNFQNTQGTVGSTQPETLQKGWAPVSSSELQQPQSMKNAWNETALRRLWSVWEASVFEPAELLAAYHENNESTKKHKNL